jgi:DNA-binding GntR family transcriptional regulator
VRHLREAILSLKYAPGEALSESQIAADLSVSRTPVREALRKLEQEGLVRIIPARGVFVSEISFKDVIEIFQVREALEVFAAALAAKRAANDEAFRKLEREFAEAHDLLDERRIDEYYNLTTRLDEEIARTCGNGRIQQSLISLWAQARRLRRMATSSSTRLHESVGEHLEILSAILAHDPVAAEAAVRSHARKSLENLVTQLWHNEAAVDSRPLATAAVTAALVP